VMSAVGAKRTSQLTFPGSAYDPKQILLVTLGVG
jgi:hypothetical protein